MKTLLKITALSVFCLLVMSAHAAMREIKVTVMIDAQREVIEFVGGPAFKVQVLLPGYATPENFEPTTETIKAMRHATAVFPFGLPFEEALMPKIRTTLSNITVVRPPVTWKVRREFEEEEIIPDSEDEKGIPQTRMVKTKDPHTWLSPLNMAQYSLHIATNLAQLNPIDKKNIMARAVIYAEGKKSEADNYKKKKDEKLLGMLKLQKEIEQKLSAFKGRTVVVMHPAYGYFLDTVGIIQLPVEKNGKTPALSTLNAFIEEAKAKECNVILTPNKDDRLAYNLGAKIGAKVMYANPLPVNYTEDMQKLANDLKKYLEMPRAVPID